MIISFIVVVFWLFYWTYVFGMKNHMKQLLLTAIGLVVPGGSEVLVFFIGVYLIYKIFFQKKNKSENCCES